MGTCDHKVSCILAYLSESVHLYVCVLMCMSVTCLKLVCWVNDRQEGKRSIHLHLSPANTHKGIPIFLQGNK